MLAVIFSFRGRINRLQYLLGLAGLFFGSFVFCCIVGAVFLALGLAVRRSVAMLIFGFFELLVLLPAIVWISFSLQARRFRDIGWEPIFVIPAWIIATAIDLAMAQINHRSGALPFFAGPTILGCLIDLVLTACLLFWPSKTYSADDFLTTEPSAEPRPATSAWSTPPRSARSSPPASATAVFGRRGG